MTAQIMSAEQLGKETGALKSKGASLLDQVGRVNITDDEVLATAGDLAKVISVQIKKSDEARTSLVKPLNDHVKFINAQFKETIVPMTEAKAALADKMNTYVSDRARKQEAEAARMKAAAEEEALQAAEAHSAAGDTDTAEAVLEAAADLPTSVPKPSIARGDLGASTSTKTNWVAAVTDVKAFLQAIIDGNIPEDFIEIKQAKLNALAVSRKVEKTNFGITISKKITASIR